jgi:transcription elongation factor GreA
MATVPLTVRGAEKLKSELQRLKSVERHAVIQAIAEARAQGDLSENAEYDAAKDKQGFIEGRILEIEAKLAAAQVIDPSRLDAGGRVVFGATVDLEDEDSGAKVTYQIVGDDEADIKLGLISISSRRHTQLRDHRRALSVIRPARRRASWCWSARAASWPA